MNSAGNQDGISRRSFLGSSGALLTGAWLAAHWPAVAAAAHHAEEIADAAQDAGAPAVFAFLAAGEAADVDAICAQIVPSGATPGAREAHAVYFIDRALATFFADWAADFRQGLKEFQAGFRQASPAAASFAAAGSGSQAAYLVQVEQAPFFGAVRTLTLLGMFSSPRYGGNFRGTGWQLMGFEDRHAFTPPFGFYDREYTGFVPYAAGKELVTSRRFKANETVDFAVVGSGAAGAVLARELAQAGFTVLVFEQGPRFSPGDFEHDELKYFFLSGITVDPKISPQSFRKSADTAAQVAKAMPPALYARLVGGSSNHFTANYWRFHEIDFNERSVLGSIPGTGFADWPITYQELEPYYTKVEWEVGVSGLAHASPFDPPRSRPYPMPPVPVKSSGVLLERGARKLGLHPFPAPMAITSQPFRGRPACVHCGFCMGFGCEAQAKSSALYTMIPEAEATGRCEVRSDSYVYQVATDAGGRATGVHYFDRDKREHFQKARAVVLSANGAETTRLLLNSKNPGHPDGLANSSGLVGKYLMFNQGASAHAVFEHELNEHKSVQVTRILHDFYDSDPKRGFYGGGGIDGRINPQPAIWAMSSGGELPSWGAALKARLEAFPRSMVSAGHSTSLPVESNSVSIDPELKDAWGIPALRVTYKDHPDDLAFARFLQDRQVEIMHAAGAQKVWRDAVEENVSGVHLLGTCRMGNDPATSVVDKYHRSHEVRNLFICDGSSFVTSGRGQPTMTIQALAFRAADHIGRFAKRNEI